MLKLPTPAQQRQLDEYSQRLAALEKQMRDLRAALKYVDPAVVTNAPKPQAKEIVWVDDDFPPKAAPQVSEGNRPFRWITTNEGPVFSGRRSLQRTGTNVHQVFFSDAAEGLLS